jgi:hypothetical protein
MPRKPSRGKKLILGDYYRQLPAPPPPSPPVTLDEALCYTQAVWSVAY